MKRSARAWLFGCLGLVLVAACGDEKDDGEPTDGSADGAPLDGEPADGEPADGEPADGEPADGDSADGSPGGQCEPGHDLSCVDEQIQQLALKDTKTGGAIVEEGQTEGEFWSFVDASAGGVANMTNGYTYARFTDTGLERVDLSDEEALASTDWDIAMRRYIIRLNSGVSGPACVQGARTAPGTTFEGLTAVPDGIAYNAEQYFTGDSCEYVPDTSGIGAPQTVLSSYWSYTMCVTMTDNVYVIALDSGRHVKAQVTSFYDPAQQTECQEAGSVGDSSSAGHIRLKWAFLD